jgi:hypothetical protein
MFSWVKERNNELPFVLEPRKRDRGKACGDDVALDRGGEGWSHRITFARPVRECEWNESL